MATAGEMILAGDLESAIHQYERAGRGSAGWNAARDWLETRHPGSNPRSFDAVLGRARDVVQIGNRYRQGGPDYAPPTSAIPDVRQLESAGAGSGRRSEFKHVFSIRMTPSPGSGAGPIYIHVSHQSSEILSRSEFEEVANTIAERFNAVFQRDSPEVGGTPRLAPEIRLEGIYRGF